MSGTSTPNASDPATDLSVNLLGIPWRLHHAWPGSELVVTKAGHEASTPGMAEALVAATDKFR